MLAKLIGKRVKVRIDEPTSFAQMNTDIVDGVIDRVLTLKNAAGRPYSIAVVRLDRPIEHGGAAFSVVSLMTRYSKHELEDLMNGSELVVNIALEDPGILGWHPDDHRIDEHDRVLNLGYGTAVLE